MNTDNENTNPDEDKPKKVKSLEDIEQIMPEDLQDSWYGNKSFEVVGTMMYLTGVEENVFADFHPSLSDKYEAFNKNAEARIIRNLCIVRTALMRNYSRITQSFVYDLKNLSTLPEYIPTDAVKELANDGLELQKTNPDVTDYIMTINLEMSNRINAVKPMFPEWLKWDYVKQLFQMPNGYKPEGIRAADNLYNHGRNCYPYQVWVNLKLDEPGNIFANDRKFVSVLYEYHGERFEDESLVTGTDRRMLTDLYDFIGRHEKLLMVVDCENSDPIKLAAVFMSLKGGQKSSIYKIMFFDSNHTTPAWETLCDTGLTKMYNAEHVVVPSLYEHKSQVDMALAVNVTQEIDMNGVDSVILASSDSDYWTLISALPDTDFLVMLEGEKSGNTLRDKLEKEGYGYCFIDDFCTGNAYGLKSTTILNSLQKKVDEIVNFNIRKMLEEEAQINWLQLTEKETDNLFDRYIKNMRLKIDSGGNVRLIIDK